MLIHKQDTNYNMQLSKDQVNTILKNAPAGADKTKILDGLIQRGHQLEGVDSEKRLQEINKLNTPEKQRLTLKDRLLEAGGDLSLGIGKDIAESSQKRADNISETLDASKKGEQDMWSTSNQVVGQLAGAGADAIGALFKGVGNVFLSDEDEKGVTKFFQEQGTKVLENPQVQKIIEGYKAMTPEEQRNLDALGGLTSLLTNFVGGEAVGRAGTLAKNVTSKVANTTKTAVADVVDTVATTAKNVAPATKDSFVKFIAPNIDDSTKNVLKNVTKEKFDDVVKIAQEASDPTKPSTYETVANSLSKSAKQLDEQVKSLSKQKDIIINKADTGLKEFTKETGKAILEINRELKNSATAKLFINKLKTVKTKLDADKIIDELQDVLYKGSKDMTIPTGTREQKILKAIIGEYNKTLKSSLPKAYTNINTQITSRLKVLKRLNTSLSEVIDGIPTRGAGLVKQFFSPTGTKTKKIFEYIKKTTGIDLAEDAVLAKYVGEAFGDTKIKSLLEGIPTSASGVIDKTVDFALEKTGLNKALKNAKQSGMIKKARDLTK